MVEISDDQWLQQAIWRLLENEWVVSLVRLSGDRILHGRLHQFGLAIERQWLIWELFALRLRPRSWANEVSNRATEELDKKRKAECKEQRNG